MSLSKNIDPSLVLVQPRKTYPFITESLLMGHKESNQTNNSSGNKMDLFKLILSLPVMTFVVCSTCLLMFLDRLYCEQYGTRSGQEVIKLISYSTQLSMKSILLINVKMPTTFISMINTTSERLKARHFFIVGILVYMS